MLALLKLLIGVGGVGAGIAVPVAVNKFVSASGQIVKAMSESNIARAIRQEITESKENEKLLEALKDLQQKNCQLINNPKNQSLFEALYACREGGDKVSSVANFYYLGKREEVKKNGVSEVKKVKTLSYERENNDYRLALTLEDKNVSQTTTVIKLSVEDQGTGGWAHFKDVDLNSSCKIVKPLLGRDRLECSLTEDGKTSLYSFGVL